jgi:hypothetical protein
MRGATLAPEEPATGQTEPLPSYASGSAPIAPKGSVLVELPDYATVVSQMDIS